MCTPGADFIQVQSEPEVVVGISQESSQSTTRYGNTSLLVRVEKYHLFQKPLLLSVLRRNTGPKSQKSIELTSSPYVPALEEARRNPRISNSSYKFKTETAKKTKRTI